MPHSIKTYAAMFRNGQDRSLQSILLFVAPRKMSVGRDALIAPRRSSHQWSSYCRGHRPMSYIVWIYSRDGSSSPSPCTMQ